MKVFFDMDGVLADFEGKLREHYKNLPADTFTIPDDQFWPMIESIPNFWESLQVMSGARKMVNYAKDHFQEIAILSAPSTHDKRSLPGKQKWLDRYFPEFKERHFVQAEEKQRFAGYGSILIDDLPKNCQQWENSGGVAIQYRDADESIKRLKVMAKHPHVLIPVRKITKDNRRITYWINPANA